MFVARNALETGSQRHGWTHQSAHFPRTPRNTHTHTHVRTVGARARRRREGHAHCISSRPTSTERPRTQQWNAVMTHLRRRSNITQHTNTRHRRFGEPSASTYSLLLLVPLFHSLSRHSSIRLLIKLQPLRFNNGIYIIKISNFT